MKFVILLFGLTLGNIANTFDNWHQSDLERWLSEHNIPYPAHSDKSALSGLVQEQWNNVLKTYEDLTDSELVQYLKSIGVEQEDTSRDSLLESLKQNWGSLKNSGSEAWDQIFSTWTESNLKAFLDSHNIPNPGEPKKESYIAAIKQNLNLLGDKIGNLSPGEWIYDTWSDSQLKEWIQEHGLQEESTRERMISSIMKYSNNIYQSSLDRAKQAGEKASSSLDSYYTAIANSWSDTDIKEWCSENGISVPDGSTRDEILSLVRKEKQKLEAAWKKETENCISGPISKLEKSCQNSFQRVTKSWNNLRLSEFLEKRGIVSKGLERDDLLKQVDANRERKAGENSDWMLEAWNESQLKHFLKSQKSEAPAGSSREELLGKAKSLYSKASASKKQELNKLMNTILVYGLFETWSNDELTDYLKSFGINAVKGVKRTYLIEAAQRNWAYFTHGVNSDGALDSFQANFFDIQNTVKHKANMFFDSVSQKYFQWRNEL